MMPGQSAASRCAICPGVCASAFAVVLSLCKSWGERLESGKLSAIIEHVRRMDGCAPHFDWEVLDGRDLEPYQDVILGEARNFGEELLQIHGKESALPVLDRFVQVAQNRRLWMRLNGGNLGKIVSQVSPGGLHEGEMMLFGLAELQDQFRIFSGRGSIFLVMDRLCATRGVASFGIGLPIEKIATVDELPKWPGLHRGGAPKKSFRNVVLSHVYGHMPACDRIPFLKTLRERTDRRGGVTLIDDLLGYPRFDPVGEMLPQPFGGDLSADVVARELKLGGWSVRKQFTLHPWSIFCVMNRSARTSPQRSMFLDRVDSDCLRQCSYCFIDKTASKTLSPHGRKQPSTSSWVLPAITSLYSTAANRSFISANQGAVV